MNVANWEQIAAMLPSIDVVSAVEAAFVAYSRGEAVVPPVGEMSFDEPPGDVHLKYGYLRGGEHYVVKIASGFYDNPSLGLPSSNGLMLLFALQTGIPVAILLDEGRLTDLRTAAAGAVAAKYLAPEVERVGIVGTGTQARLQLCALEQVIGCREVVVWGRRDEALEAMREHVPEWTVHLTRDIDELIETANLIVTTTPSREPLVGRVRPGTHVTAVGSDTPDKQELSAELVGSADVIVADSMAQCRVRGEISQALRAGHLRSERVVELGAVIAGDAVGRRKPGQVSIADLTGVAVQDLAITEAVYRGLVAS